MEAELLELVADRSEELVQLFCHNGVQTCQDVVGIWSHGGELVAELEHLQGPLDAEEAFQVSALWTLAARRAHDHHRRVARAVTGNRLSVVETTSMVVAPKGAGPRGHVRQLLETGFPGRPPMLLAAVASDPHTKEEAKRATKTPALFEILLSEFLNLEEFGVTSWEELGDPVRLQQLKDQITQATGRLTEARIGALLAALRRWHRYASEKTYRVAKPTPLQLPPCSCSRGPYCSIINVPGLKVVPGHVWPPLQRGPLAYSAFQVATAGPSGAAEDGIATLGAGEPFIDDEEGLRYTLVDFCIFRLGSYLTCAF